MTSPGYITSRTTGPFITIDDAATWSGRSAEAVYDAAVAGRFKTLSVGSARSDLRVDERSFGKRYKLPLPGPRELELEMEIAERRGLRETSSKARTGVDHWLYWFYDLEGRLLYVGMTNQGVRRMEQHGADKVWWPQVATIKVDHFAARGECEVAEVEAIKTHRPAYNGTHNLKHRQPAGPSFEEAIV